MNCLVRPENYAKKVSIENGIDYGEEDVVVKKKEINFKEECEN